MSTVLVSIGNGGYNIASDLRKSGRFSNGKFIVCDTASDELSDHAQHAYATINIAEDGDFSSLYEQIVTKEVSTIVLVASLGGATGSSEFVPRLAKKALSDKIKVCSIVSIPFLFEKEAKCATAMKTLTALVQYSHTIVIQNNENIKSYDTLKLNEMNQPIIDLLSSNTDKL